MDKVEFTFVIPERVEVEFVLNAVKILTGVGTQERKIFLSKREFSNLEIHTKHRSWFGDPQ